MQLTPEPCTEDSHLQSRVRAHDETDPSRTAYRQAKSHLLVMSAGRRRVTCVMSAL